MVSPPPLEAARVPSRGGASRPAEPAVQGSLGVNAWGRFRAPLAFGTGAQRMVSGIVTGPSLTKATCMSAPNCPAATCG